MTASKRARTLLAGYLLAGTALLPLGLAGPAQGAAAGSEFTATKTVTRTNLDADGHDQVVASKDVTVHVSQTRELHGRQNVDVSWSGATPTGGIQPDLNGVQAPQQEYPMAILECRGREGAGVPAADRVDPSTCWTHGAKSRWVGLGYTRFGPWRLDRYASVADRARVVGRPHSATAKCGGPTATEHWLPFRAADGKSYYYGNNACAGLPPEDYPFDSSAQLVPPNATFAPTSVDGTGSVKFDVWTDSENASLGCTARVDCTLEIIPIMGISCDPYGRSDVATGLPATDVPKPDDVADATKLCEATGQFRPGDLAGVSTQADLAVTGSLWWSASNWRNRISVPLSFAPVSHACDQVSGRTPVDVYGSELMTEAAQQWSAKFCLDPKLFPLTHVQTAEPLAQRELADPTSGVDAAFSSLPPDGGFGRPTVQAPVAVSGFAISYNIDDAEGNAVTNLRLDPRLLAKLLTESYPGTDFSRFDTDPYPYLKNNPVNITADPEFQALNPGITSLGHDFPGPATLISLSSESDVTSAVTAYINADPEARAWLNGKPDPWGMVVNAGPGKKGDAPNYKGIALPTLRWPLLDTTIADFGDQTVAGQCNIDLKTPWLPLIASPTPTLATTAVDVQFASSPGKTLCVPLNPADPNQGNQWISTGRMQPGQRFVMGITTLGEAARYDLETANLQSESNVTDPGAQFTDAGGRTFVGPTPASLTAAAKHFTIDKTTQTWRMPYPALRHDAAAYPGTMIINADVPTSGLDASVAADYATLLEFAAGDGQTPGPGSGQLPTGYLPMTAADGLAAQAEYTKRAAAAVSAQAGVVPPIIAPPVPPSSSTPTHTPSTGRPTHATTAPPPGGQLPPPAGGASSSTAPSSSAPSTSASSTPTPSISAVAQTVTTPSVGIGAAKVIVPVLLAVALLGGLLAGGGAYGSRIPRLPSIRRGRHR